MWIEEDRSFRVTGGLTCSFCTTTASISSHAVLQRDTVKAASEFAKRNQLTPHIRDQILSHVCLNFKTERLKQKETLNGLPKAIRSSIAHYLFHPIVQTVYLFHGVSKDFLLQLVPETEAEYYTPREDVILQNEAPTDAYILVTGNLLHGLMGRIKLLEGLVQGIYLEK